MRGWKLIEIEREERERERKKERDREESREMERGERETSTFQTRSATLMMYEDVGGPHITRVDNKFVNSNDSGTQ